MIEGLVVKKILFVLRQEKMQFTKVADAIER